MLAALAIALGLVLAVLSGGDLRALRHASLDGQTAILAAFFIQSIARGAAARFLGAWSVVIWGFCSVALLLLLVHQWRNAGLSIAAVGIGANALVILLNGGMPVVPPPGSGASAVAAISGSHGFYQLADSRTYLTFLGDVLPAGFGVASAGDVLLALGATLFIVMEANR